MKRQTRYILLFLLVISISFLPFIGIYSIMSGRPENIWLTILLNIPACFLIGICDYLFIKFMQKVIRRNTLRVVTDLIVTTLTTLPIICGLNLILMNTSPVALIKSALPAIPWNWVVTLLIELYFYNERQQKIEREKSRYQFIALRNQINPHFLFNCLNVLSSLAYSDGEKANVFTKRLSAVYRYLLSNAENRTVNIDDELEFVKKYIYLEQVRFGESLRVNIEDNREIRTGHVIPVSVQLLVENAIKHNICTADSPLNIDISINDSEVRVVNTLLPRKSSSDTRLGLDNIRLQYALHNKEIAVEKTDGTFTVILPVIA